jgi:hypothetical protein
MRTFKKISAIVPTIALTLGLIGPSIGFAAGPAPINLFSITTNNFGILAKTTITDANPTLSAVTGNVGLSPAAGSFITGLSCTEVLPIGTSKIYEVDDTYTGGHDSNTVCKMANPPLANKTLVDNAVLDMGTAYTNASDPATPAGVGPNLNIGGGTVSTQTLAPGTYTWGSNVTITGDLTLSGGANDVWIFQITGTLDLETGKKILLTGGAQASNVFWRVSGATTLKAGSTMEGTILDQTSIAMQAGAILHGRALAQTAVTLIGNTVTVPTASVAAVVTSSAVGRRDGTINVVKTVINNSGGTKTVADFPLFVDSRLVVSGETNNFAAPHDGYVVSETSSSNYVRSFSGDCDENGRFNLTPGQNQFCIVTNDDIGPAAAVVPPIIDVVKVPSPLSLPGGAGPVTYTYTVSNLGTIPVSNIKMVGDTCSPIVLTSGDMNNDGKLDVNEKWIYTCSTTLTETHTNTVIATGVANGLTATDIASATVVVGLPVVPPLIHVTQVPSPLTLLTAGGQITFTEKVTNPGTVPVSNINVINDKCFTVRYISGDMNGDSKLDTSETWTYACQAGFTKTTVNTAVATGQANGLSVRDFAIVTVPVAAPGLPNTGLDRAMTRASARASFMRSLSMGIEGDDVVSLQTLLEQKGLLKMPNGVAKGFFGNLTRAAVLKYQTNLGLPMVGIFGPMTRAKLISELSE